MISLPTAYLLFNGSLVILAGLILGFPLRYAIVKKKEEIVNAWRVAHSVLVMDGLMMLIIGLIIPHLILGELAVWVLVLSLVASGYGFVVAFTIGALKGVRGLTAKPFGLNTLLFAAHIVGASGSLIGIVIVFYGAMKTIL
jgi:hypothetical protein